MKITIPFTNLFSCYPDIAGKPDMESEIDHWNDERKDLNLPPLTDEQIDKLTDAVANNFRWKIYEKGMSDIIDDFIKTELAPILTPYGLLKLHGELYMPKSYNYSSDSCDISFEIDFEELFYSFPKLIPYIEKYITEVKEKSYDGYMSFEADSLAELDFYSGNDYNAILWAILEKENRHDMKQELADILYENAHEIYNDSLDWDVIEKIALSKK